MGAEGPSDYRGEVDVTATGDESTVTVSLHTERADGAGIRVGPEDTVATLKRVLESSSTPGLRATRLELVEDLAAAQHAAPDGITDRATTWGCTATMSTTSRPGPPRDPTSSAAGRSTVRPSDG